jgi:hypothetical protein
MIETPLPLAPARWGTVPAPDSAPLLEQLATLWLENAALRGGPPPSLLLTARGD